MAISAANEVRLEDGSRLSYAQIGDPRGEPILHFHGMPMSRLEIDGPGFDAVATRLGARVIAVDRPGVGLSDFWPYQIGDWPEVVSEVADILGLANFAVTGLSSGGKFVCACAWKIPERLTSATIIGGNAPIDVPEVSRSLTQHDRDMYGFAVQAPERFGQALAQIAAEAQKDPATILNLVAQLAAPDQAVLAREDSRRWFQEAVLEAFHSGTEGVAWEWRLEALDWGFDLAETRMPVTVWHGEQDKLVPVEHGRYLARTLPRGQARFLPEEGHLSLFTSRFGEILQDALHRVPA